MDILKKANECLLSVSSWALLFVLTVFGLFFVMKGFEEAKVDYLLYGVISLTALHFHVKYMEKK